MTIIKNIEVRRVNLELTRPYSISYKTVTSVENVVVKIELNNGRHGIGTCNPSKLVVGESVDDSAKILFQNNHTDWLIGRDIRHVHSLCSELQHRFPSYPGVRAALDIALWDAFTTYLGVPLVEYLGRTIHQLPTSITIGIKGVQETLEEAREYVSKKFFVLKIKTGVSLEEDIERLTKLREVFGQDIIIRIDSNQGYTVQQTIEFFQRIRHLTIELNEQPILASAIEEMRSLPDDIKKTIAADESLLTPADAFQLVQSPRACGIFNIKLMKCGGISPALDIATIANHGGADLMWGCNDESIVSITAALHTAFSCSRTKYIDLDGSFDLANDVVRGGFRIQDGVMTTTDKPGLGVEFIA